MGDDRDILISRIADGEGSPADWVAFERDAARDPTLWRDLAIAQRHAAEFADAMLDAAAIAARVELPASGLRLANDRAPASVVRRIGWAGWAAAAMVGVAWVGMNGRGGDMSTPGATTQNASLLSSAADLLNGYLDRGKQEGKVVGQVPSGVVVDAHPSEDGRGYDVYFLRQIIERVHVDRLDGLAFDEYGRPYLSATSPVMVARDPM